MIDQPICIIPARGGSKRIPKKNIREFHGRPILSYVIATAIESGLFSEVLVSTDNREIAEIAENHGASVPFFRSSSASSDDATTTEVLTEVLQRLGTEGHNYPVACCFYPTAALTTTEQLKEGRSLLRKGFDTVLPVVRYGYPIWRSFSRNGDGEVRFIWPEHLQTRTQDLEPTYHDAGQWYWFSPELLVGTGSLFAGRTGSVVIPEDMVHDIDTERDWRIAEIKYDYLFIRGSG